MAPVRQTIRRPVGHEPRHMTSARPLRAWLRRFARRTVRGRIPAVAGLTLPLVLGTGPLSGAAGPGPVQVLQLNLCGSGFASCWTGRAVDRAVAAVTDLAPDVVTLNEICAGDLAVLRRALARAHHGGGVAGAFAMVLGGDLNLGRVCAHPGYRERGSGVQHVLAAGARIEAAAEVDLAASTDHPGLLVSLTRD